MRRFFVVVGGLGFLCGCAALDSTVGLNPDGSVDPSGGPLGSGAGLLGSFIPWAGAALGAVGTLYSQIRRKKYADALGSTINGISAVRRLRSESGEIKRTDEGLVKILREIQDADKTKKLISKVVKKNGNQGG